MAGPATHDQADLVGRLLAPGDDSRGRCLDDLAMGADEALQQLVHGVERIVDQLLEHGPNDTADARCPVGLVADAVHRLEIRCTVFPIHGQASAPNPGTRC